MEQLIKYGGLLVLSLLGVIYYAFSRIGALKQDVGRAKAEAELGKVVEKIQEAQDESKKAVGDYHSVRDQYLAQERESRK